MYDNKVIAAKNIEKLLQFGVHKEMISPWDIPQVRNQLLDILKIEEPYDSQLEVDQYDTPSAILSELLDYAAEIGIIENTTTERDLLDAKIMAQLMPRQSELIKNFNQIVKEKGIMAGTDYFYELSQNSNYIRMDRIAKNMHWLTETPYGTLEITINLSKPEKDPKEIAALRTAATSNYPKCLLCLENVGYAGRLNHPGRSNHRVIPITLDNEQWYIQYSPYVYYNEHAIVFSQIHRPMQISADTFKRLLEFVQQVPHYFIGSNADLPIVGGSILSHDHFQAGHHTFPMEKAEVIQEFKNLNYHNTTLQIIKWPLSVIRLVSPNQEEILNLATKILELWRNHSDETVGIIAFTGDTPHNTITPIARKNKEGLFELDLALRNNRTDAEHPDGIFHPYKHLHSIKKENIGLIEVMGLAILPDRLKTEMSLIGDILTGKLNQSQWREIESLEKHSTWIDSLIASCGNGLEENKAKEIVENEVGLKFKEVLECSGVYKQTAEGLGAFEKFMNLCTYL